MNICLRFCLQVTNVTQNVTHSHKRSTSSRITLHKYRIGRSVNSKPLTVSSFITSSKYNNSIFKIISPAKAVQLENVNSIRSHQILGAS